MKRTRSTPLPTDTLIDKNLDKTRLNPLYTILLIGYDAHICLSIACALRKRPYRLLFLTSHSETCVIHSRLVSRVFTYSGYDETLEAVQRVALEESIDLIMPFDEIESFTVSSLRGQLEAIAPVSALTASDMFATAISKNRLYSLLSDHGVHVMPKSVLSERRPLEVRDAVGMEFPLLVKPARSSFGRGILHFKNSPSLHRHLTTSDNVNYALQEYVHGSDITCNIIAQEGEVLVHTVQESPTKQLGNYSRNDDLEFKNDEEVLEIVSRVARILKWNGVACFDLRRRASDNKIFLLEINGRFWGSLLASWTIAGVNFPDLLIRQALGLRWPKIEKKEGMQLSLRVAAIKMFNGRLFSLKHTKYTSYLVDPVARFLKYF